MYSRSDCESGIAGGLIGGGSSSGSGGEEGGIGRDGKLCGGGDGGGGQDPVEKGVEGYTYSVVQHESTRETSGGLGRSRPATVELGEGLPLSQ